MKSIDELDPKSNPNDAQYMISISMLSKLKLANELQPSISPNELKDVIQVPLLWLHQVHLTRRLLGNLRDEPFLAAVKDCGIVFQGTSSNIVQSSIMPAALKWGHENIESIEEVMRGMNFNNLN